MYSTVDTANQEWLSLNSNEKVLNNLLLIEEEAEGYSANLNNIKNEEEEDGMEDEWNGLANCNS